jgi:hypothetical protein
MKYPSRKVFFRFMQFAILAASVFSVRALAQAEIAPDHFDSTPSAATSKPADSAAAVKKSTTTGLSANQAQQADRQGSVAQGNGRTSETDKSARGPQHSTSAKSASAQPAKNRRVPLPRGLLRHGLNSLGLSIYPSPKRILCRPSGAHLFYHSPRAYPTGHATARGWAPCGVRGKPGFGLQGWRGYLRDAPNGADYRRRSWPRAPKRLGLS